MATPSYTIGQWLKGKVDFILADSQLYAACVDYGITPNTEYSECSEKARDLSLANIYDFVGRSSSVTSAAYDSDGGWQHRDAAKSVVNRGWYLAEARRLRRKWGINDETTSGITFKDIY